jgi:hypothetical protein
LAGEGGEVGVAEVLREDVGGEGVGVGYEEGSSLVVPTDGGTVVGVGYELPDGLDEVWHLLSLHSSIVFFYIFCTGTKLQYQILNHSSLLGGLAYFDICTLVGEIWDGMG